MNYKTKGMVLLGVLALAYASLHGTSNSSPVAAPIVEPVAPAAAAEPTDDSSQVRGGETYGQYDARRDDADTGRYSGADECTEDCSGHDAGREWAEQHSVTNPDDCGGNSWSFTEGCQSYASEQSGEDESEKGEEAKDDD